MENRFIRDDLYQIISYMHTMKIPRGGFIYPISSTTSKVQSYEIDVKTYKLANDTGTVSTIAFPIPQNAKNYKDFSEMIKITERKILEQNKTFML